MRAKKLAKGTAPPLFDRIVDNKDIEGPISELLTLSELKESIVHELSLILNTRCTVRKVIYQDHMQTIPFFGLPDFFGLEDFSYFDASNTSEWPQATRIIETAIQAAEPRLQNVQVNIENYNAIDQTLNVLISGLVREAETLKALHFPIAIHHRRHSSRHKAA